MRINALLAKILPGLALLLMSHLSWGQGLPSYSPPPIPMHLPMAPMGYENLGNNNPYYRQGEGSYQTAEGDWHRAEKMRFDREAVRIMQACEACR